MFYNITITTCLRRSGSFTWTKKWVGEMAQWGKVFLLSLTTWAQSTGPTCGRTELILSSCTMTVIWMLRDVYAHTCTTWYMKYNKNKNNEIIGIICEFVGTFSYLETWVANAHRPDSKEDKHEMNNTMSIYYIIPVSFTFYSVLYMTSGSENLYFVVTSV